MAGFKSNVAGRWPAGTKLGVYPRVADSFSGAHEAVKSLSVKADGAVEVSGLDEGLPYWLADDEGRAVAFTAKDPKGKVSSPLSKQVEAHGPQSAAPGRSTEPNVITGARGSGSLKGRHQAVQFADDRKVTDSEPQPHVNQLDVPKGTPQRSDTAFGQATPKDRDEIVPRPSQDDVKGPQRSDTEYGEATPKPRDEVEPFVSQEDTRKGLQQRSDTELGSAEPKLVQGRAGKKSRVEAEKARDSSDSKAAGSTEQQSAAQTSKRAQRK